MVQFYFLSVLVNILAGLVLVYGADLTAADGGASLDDDPFGDTDFDAASGADNALVRDFNALNSKSLRLVVGVLAVVVGVLKLGSVYQGLAFAGDFIPAVAGILGGGSLLVEYLLTSATVELSLPDALRSLFVGCRRYIGVLCLVAGVLHFIAPQAPLL